jgi:hypothetical protein
VGGGRRFGRQKPLGHTKRQLSQHLAEALQPPRGGGEAKGRGPGGGAEGSGRGAVARPSGQRFGQGSALTKLADTVLYFHTEDLQQATTTLAQLDGAVTAPATCTLGRACRWSPSTTVAVFSHYTVQLTVGETSFCICRAGLKQQAAAPLPDPNRPLPATTASTMQLWM